MTTALDIKRERDLLSGMGLQPVTHWPPRCVWYRPDGSPVGKLGCDSYSRLLYLGKGLRPSTLICPRKRFLPLTLEILPSPFNLLPLTLTSSLFFIWSPHDLQCKKSYWPRGEVSSFPHLVWVPTSEYLSFVGDALRMGGGSQGPPLIIRQLFYKLYL